MVDGRSEAFGLKRREIMFLLLVDYCGLENRTRARCKKGKISYQ